MPSIAAMIGAVEPTVAAHLAALRAVAPFDRAADWDPVGLQLGDLGAFVARVAVCHEVTAAVVDATLESGSDLLISYHPLLFRPTTRLVAGPSATGRAYRLAAGGVSLAVVHTAFDVAPGGAADALADELELVDIESFAPLRDPDLATDRTVVPSDAGFVGRIGRVAEPVPLGDLVSRIERYLGTVSRVAAAGSPAPIARVAVIPGSGGSFVEAAITAGADVLVTGDVGHHQARAANEAGLSVVDAGHTPTERPGVKRLYAAVSAGGTPTIDLTELDVNPWEAI